MNDSTAMRTAKNICHDLHEGHIAGCGRCLTLADAPAAREAIAEIVRQQLAEDFNEIEIHCREIHSAANPQHMGRIASERIRGEIAQIRRMLAGVLIPVTGTSTVPGDLRLTRPDRLKCFAKGAANE